MSDIVEEEYSEEVTDGEDGPVIAPKPISKRRTQQWEVDVLRDTEKELKKAIGQIRGELALSYGARAELCEAATKLVVDLKGQLASMPGAHRAGIEGALIRFMETLKETQGE